MAMSGNNNLADQQSTSIVADKLVQLSKALDRRTKAIKAELLRFGDGFSSTLLPSDVSDDEDRKADSLNNASPHKSTTPKPAPTPIQQFRAKIGGAAKKDGSVLWGFIKHGAIDTSTFLYRVWLSMLSFAFLYNFWSITLRASFPVYQEGEKLTAWLVMDYVCDLAVLSDIVFVKPRLAFYDKGLLVFDKKVLRKTYLKSPKFILDILSLLPLDLCYLAVGYVQPLFRLPRLLNVRTFLDFFDRLDRSSSIPELFRMIKTLIYILMTVHLYTCVYYLFSEQLGVGSDSFVFEGDPWPAYSRCFFITFKMATRIGSQQKETHNTPERGLMAVFWLTALCVEIVLLAQVREIFLSVTKEDDEFRLLLSAALTYVRRYKCPMELEKKVRDWFTYTRDTQKTLDEDDIFKLLPKHLRIDLAFDIHYTLLSKVSIFENCERSVIADVVVKLKVEMFFPNDVIYKKGEVGKNMYIIEKGQAEVVDDNGIVQATLTQGAVFGERSLLALGTNNRRHVTVRSKGYSNLFVLSKEDFEEIMIHHPKIYRRLRKKASVFDSKHDDITASTTFAEKPNASDIAPVQPMVTKTVRPTTPKLLRLMLKILPGRSSVLKRLMKVHPASLNDDAAFETSSNDFDPEIAALHWSSPSPDQYYVPQEWELRHFNKKLNDDNLQRKEQVREAFVDAPAQESSGDDDLHKSSHKTKQKAHHHHHHHHQPRQQLNQTNTEQKQQHHHHHHQHHHHEKANGAASHVDHQKTPPTSDDEDNSSSKADAAKQHRQQSMVAGRSFSALS